MNKYFGLYSALILIPLFLVVWQLSNILQRADSIFANWLLWLLLNFIFFSIFGNFIKMEKGRIIIYRPFWFLHKRNKFDINEINTVRIRNGGQARGASVSISFFDFNDKYIGGFLCQMLNVELKRMKRSMEELGLDVEVDEVAGRKI